MTKGTVGESIDSLVKEYGGYTLGIYVLEQALREAIEAEGRCTFDGKLISEHAQYLEIWDAETKLMEEIKQRA